jgi:hypothetical protein
VQPYKIGDEWHVYECDALIAKLRVIKVYEDSKDVQCIYSGDSFQVSEGHVFSRNKEDLYKMYEKNDKYKIKKYGKFSYLRDRLCSC